MISDRLCIIDGIRTPFAKSGGAFADLHAEDLGVLAVRELLDRTGLDPARLDGVVTGNVGQSSRAANVSRVIALRAGVPRQVPAMTVHRNCASGFEAITQCAEHLEAGRGSLFLAVGCESMSNYPLEFNRKARDFFAALARARSPWRKLRTLLRLRPAMFKPLVALLEGLRDPVVGLNMGQTAELLAREWNLTREDQDAFARRSHAKALEARDRLREETFDVAHAKGLLRDDDGIRDERRLAKLDKLPTVFQRAHGTVTAGSASQITDGAVALLVGSRQAARDLGLEPLGELESFAYAGCEPERMGFGPVYALDRLFPDRRDPFEGIDLFEINEAFAAQVLACLQAMKDPTFCKERLGREAPLGELPEELLNVNGGAVALGHPVGASGARLVLTALKELGRRGQTTALVSLCVGGGQGGALLLNAG